MSEKDAADNLQYNQAVNAGKDVVHDNADSTVNPSVYHSDGEWLQDIKKTENKES